MRLAAILALLLLPLPVFAAPIPLRGKFTGGIQTSDGLMCSNVASGGTAWNFAVCTSGQTIATPFSAGKLFSFQGDPDGNSTFNEKLYMRFNGQMVIPANGSLEVNGIYDGNADTDTAASGSDSIAMSSNLSTAVPSGASAAAITYAIQGVNTANTSGGTFSSSITNITGIRGVSQSNVASSSITNMWGVSGRADLGTGANTGKLIGLYGTVLLPSSGSGVWSAGTAVAGVYGDIHNTLTGSTASSRPPYTVAGFLSGPTWCNSTTVPTANLGGTFFGALYAAGDLRLDNPENTNACTASYTGHHGPRLEWSTDASGVGYNYAYTSIEAGSDQLDSTGGGRKNFRYTWPRSFGDNMTNWVMRITGTPDESTSGEVNAGLEFASPATILSSAGGFSCSGSCTAGKLAKFASSTTINDSGVAQDASDIFLTPPAHWTWFAGDGVLPTGSGTQDLGSTVKDWRIIYSRQYSASVAPVKVLSPPAVSGNVFEVYNNASLAFAVAFNGTHTFSNGSFALDQDGDGTQSVIQQDDANSAIEFDPDGDGTLDFLMAGGSPAVFRPNTSFSADLGTSLKQWGTIYGSALNTSTITGAGGAVLFSSSTVQIDQDSDGSLAVLGESGGALTIDAGASGTPQTVIGTKVTTYDSVTTAGKGVVPIHDVVQLTGQTADIGNTGFTHGNTAGLYRVSYYLVTTTPDALGGTVTFNLEWVDVASTARDISSDAVILSSLGATNSYAQGTVFVNVDNSDGWRWNTTHTGLFGTADYALYLTLEKLSD